MNSNYKFYVIETFSTEFSSESFFVDYPRKEKKNQRNVRENCKIIRFASLGTLGILGAVTLEVCLDKRGGGRFFFFF